MLKCVDVGEMVHLRLDVARDGEVEDERSGPRAAAEARTGLSIVGRDDGLRRARGGQDDVDLPKRLRRLLPGDDPAAECSASAVAFSANGS